MPNLLSTGGVEVETNNYTIKIMNADKVTEAVVEATRKSGSATVIY